MEYIILTSAKARYEDDRPILYSKAPESAHIDCGRILGGDKDYTEHHEIAQHLRGRTEKATVAMKFHWKRVLPLMKIKRIDFGVAHARTACKVCK
ncbi:hypothetical protein ANCDUO_15314 [Ancylostoma duodenale]|uniref:Uncharacterized protein n=1 Tax=Ancylostoma duodenale TaxID=51022 RepID=A0A0C2G6J2_9BILA|nr:hypothetical protein ANCDUO_15314 [Ancylostoma duodenale]